MSPDADRPRTPRRLLLMAAATLLGAALVPAALVLTADDRDPAPGLLTAPSSPAP